MTKAQRLTDAERRDLDETRRLLYMALVYSRANGRHELAGTLINTLLHHQKVDAPRDAVIDRVLKGLDGDPDAAAWLRAQGQRIIDELEGN